MKNKRLFHKQNSLNKIVKLNFDDFEKKELFLNEIQDILKKYNGEDITATTKDLMYSEKIVTELNEVYNYCMMERVFLNVIALLNIDLKKEMVSLNSDLESYESSIKIYDINRDKKSLPKLNEEKTKTLMNYISELNQHRYGFGVLNYIGQSFKKSDKNHTCINGSSSTIKLKTEEFFITNLKFFTENRYEETDLLLKLDDLFEDESVTVDPSFISKTTAFEDFEIKSMKNFPGSIANITKKNVFKTDGTNALFATMIMSFDEKNNKIQFIHNEEYDFSEEINKLKTFFERDFKKYYLKVKFS